MLASGNSRCLACASSKGLGKGCVGSGRGWKHLAQRGSDALNETAEAIRSRFNVRKAVVADITTPEGQVLTRAGAVDILVNNVGGPLRGWSDWGR